MYNDINDILNSYIGEKFSEDVLKKLQQDFADYLYNNHGYCDELDSPSFKPVIPDIDIVISFDEEEDRSLTVRLPSIQECYTIST